MGFNCIKTLAVVVPNKGSLLIFPNTWSSWRVIVGVSVKIPWVVLMVNTVSKVFTLSTAGKRSPPISVTSNLEQPQFITERKEKEIINTVKNLLCTMVKFRKWVVGFT